MKKEWLIKNVFDGSKSIIEQIMDQRGISKKEDIVEFLNPEEFKAISPYAFNDMQKAIDRIKEAISKKENILIYGDFDADGITSTSLLIRTFKYLGLEVDYFIPDREKNGHGLNFSALVKVIAKRKPNLIITVDCGISNTKEVKQLKAFGIDTIITDHHEAPLQIPEAVAIINPKAPFKLNEALSTKQIISLTSLAGVGVAFKLASALLFEFDKNEFILNLLPLVAVGTISDVVPLVYENRYLVVKGLDLIGNHYGIRRLLEESLYNLENGVTTDQIAFGVTPRLNATGRLGSVSESVTVLVSDNKSQIDLAVMSLNNCNKIRQELCDNMFLEAQEMEQCENSIILFNRDWHVGIIGIVASRLVETFNKPTFLMTYNEENNQIRCSARGVQGLNIFEILSSNSEIFDNFGGHAMAGGFSFTLDKHSFEEVKEVLDRTINEFLAGKKLKPILNIDLEISSDDLNENLIQDIDRLQPFGAENPLPIFAICNMKLLQKKVIGAEKNHLRLVVSDESKNTFTCLWWFKDSIPLVEGDSLDIAFVPQINIFNGNKSLQLIVNDIRSEKMVDETPSKYTIYDHRKKIGIFSNIEDYLKNTKLNIGVFAEDNNVIEQLKQYPQIYNRLFSRVNYSQYDAIMFFDYPACLELFDEIVNNTHAKILHFMKYESKNFDESSFIKKIQGMIKYSCNHYNGIFNIKNAASKLAMSQDVIIETINALDSVNAIEIKDRTDDAFEISLLDFNCQNIVHSELYSSVLTEIKIVCDYKETFSVADLKYFVI